MKTKVSDASVHEFLPSIKKGCLYITKLDDVDTKVLKELITRSVKKMAKAYA